MPENTSSTRLNALFDAQRHAFIRKDAPSLSQRQKALDLLLDLIDEHTHEVADAIIADFGSRPRQEILLSELYTTVSGIRHIQKHLKNWMRAQKRSVPLIFAPGRAEVRIQPKGVVGVISPWNYPFYLAVMPMATALAAGNRVMLKPSELTPRTSETLSRLLAGRFPPEQVSVVTGGPEVGADFSRLAFDHLLFTGSTSLGKVIMKAAAENLTPVTLELGGKSPALIGPDFSLSRAAENIAAAKCFNAGQTCVAPDFVLAPSGKIPDFVEQFKLYVARFYPTLAHNPDYTAIINDRHYQRIQGLIREAEERGATVIRIQPSGEAPDPRERKIPPTLVLDAPLDIALLTDEIFGPVLPVVGYNTTDEALAYINDRPRPLALYVFDDNTRRVNHVLGNTTSGTACVNAAMVQVAVDDLPFGGAGESGMGAYHAREGFEAFSHKKAIFYQGKLSSQVFIRPPYKKGLEKIIKRLIKH